MRRPTVDAGPPPLGLLKEMLSAWPFKPHRWSSTTAGDLDRLLLSRVVGALDEQGAHAWSAIEADRLAGLAILRPLAWDSRVLGIPAARLELFVGNPYTIGRSSAEALLDSVVDHCRQHGLRHLSIRVDAANDTAIHALETLGFLNVDALMTFAAETGDLPADVRLEGFEIRLAEPADTEPIATIAALGFRDGRFHADPSIPADKAREVYRTWAAACCDGSAADAAIVATQGDVPVGFIACRMLADTAVHLQRPTGTIPLVAASAAVRGRGIGRVLVAAAARWFRQERALVVEVGTQLRNVPAARLYGACGFKLAAGSLSFRLMLES